MDTKKLVYGLIGVLVVGIVGFALLRNTSSQNQTQESPTSTQETANNVQGVQADQANTTQALEQRYLTYSEENLARVTENNGKAVIFFAASWCPMCQAAEKDFKANFDQVPANVTILKTDYDTATDLKAKYNITMQDTFVQVDRSGNEITKWNSGGEGIKTLLASLK